MNGPTKQQIEELIDSIAREWDGCEHEDSRTPDIGDAIRRAGRPRIAALFRDLAAGVLGTLNEQGEKR